ncbi:uncharacterized protein LOC133549811 isoform X1 [Nerophis ophidion]|uniref:uncharacterized protein LOC133549811 isoform X1 n=1 Tax=Nerophis ophidion TaxID=159077 RepID=UPI002AE04A1E|nr:uncharacterized protein LOC133549811 isoform X1 [Nerophis ophidion]
MVVMMMMRTMRKTRSRVMMMTMVMMMKRNVVMMMMTKGIRKNLKRTRTKGKEIEVWEDKDQGKEVREPQLFFFTLLEEKVGGSKLSRTEARLRTGGGDMWRDGADSGRRKAVSLAEMEARRRGVRRREEACRTLSRTVATISAHHTAVRNNVICSSSINRGKEEQTGKSRRKNPLETDHDQQTSDQTERRCDPATDANPGHRKVHRRQKQETPAHCKVPRQPGKT